MNNLKKITRYALKAMFMNKTTITTKILYNVRVEKEDEKNNCMQIIQISYFCLTLIQHSSSTAFSSIQNLIIYR